MKYLLTGLFFWGGILHIYGQNAVLDRGSLSGNFMSNFQAYDKDPKIGANTEVYNKHKSSADAWLFLNYNISGYSFSLRYDMFNNSPLLNPQSVYNKQGIGFWQASKDIGGLNLTAGYFYDQFGSGMIFRSYEERMIGLDYAVQGLRVKYNYKNLAIKAFAGQQKGNIFTGDRFGVSPQALKGFNAEYTFNLAKNLRFSPGASTVNRTLDQTTMNAVATQINSQPLAERFIPKYNVYAHNGYATLAYKDITLYGEYVYKSREAIYNQFGTALINRDGNIIFTTLSYSKANLGKKKQFSFGANLQYKRIENFDFRTSPFETLNNGLISYLPSITRQNTYRLLARYTAVTQMLGENAYQGELIITPKRGTTITLNISDVNSLSSNGDSLGRPKKLFRERYLEIQHKINKKLKGKLGVQYIYYDQQRYQQKDTSYHDVVAITPFFEITYKFNSKTSLRIEGQYLETGQDLGSFANAVIELNYTSHWSFSVGDMVNTKPLHVQPGFDPNELIHYYSAYVGYTSGPTVVSLAYIKQVQGVNCTGGICRVEPAFSGVRATLTTSF